MPCVSFPPNIKKHCLPGRLCSFPWGRGDDGRLSSPRKTLQCRCTPRWSSPRSATAQSYTWELPAGSGSPSPCRHKTPGQGGSARLVHDWLCLSMQPLRRVRHRCQTHSSHTYFCFRRMWAVARLLQASAFWEEGSRGGRVSGVSGGGICWCTCLSVCMRACECRYI